MTNKYWSNFESTKNNLNNFKIFSNMLEMIDQERKAYIIEFFTMQNNKL